MAVHGRLRHGRLRTVASITAMALGAALLPGGAGVALADAEPAGPAIE
jgi:hypothetical protein